MSARWWRQIGFWGLTLNAVCGFPALMLAMWLAPRVDWSLMATVYPMVLAAWCTAAGIRQWGKNNSAEGPAPERRVLGVTSD